MMKRYILHIWMWMLTLLMVTSCTDHDFFGNEEEMVNVTYTIGFSDAAGSRAIGDGNNVDQLYIGIYEDGKEVKRLEETIKNGMAKVEITLFKDRIYDLAFWAQSSNTSVYNISDLKNVQITYPTDEISLDDAADMDAFSLLKEDVTVVTGNDDGGSLTLTRPYALLNIAAIGDCDEVEKTELTVTYENETNPMTLVFTDSAIEGDYTYLASAFLKPGNITASVRLLGEGDKEIKSFNVNEGSSFTLVKNYRYNVIGNVVVGWNGAIPEISPLTTDEQNRYIIDEEADLAWLSVADNTSTLSASTFVVTKETLDMGSHEISSIQLPTGSTFDGGGNTIKNYANSLFGNATNITVQNLNLDHVVAESVDGHVGVLVNTLKGSGTFTNVSITNSSATTTSGAAGGMIGYIVRASEQSRSESLEVSIEDCTISQTSISATESEGKFVGLLSGYDNGEKLIFNDCTADVEISSTYTDNGFLGNETYCRGLVTMDGNRFMPKWDGERTVEPLLANPIFDGENAVTGNNKYVIYSPFDLAGVREKTASPAAIYLKADIDMNGQGEDGKFNVPSNFTQSAIASSDDNDFTPFNYVTTLDGYKDAETNYTIYNLSISLLENKGAAFILNASGETVHKNINFNNCQTVATHISTVTTDAKAYGAILVSNVEGTSYKMSNIHATNCKVFALQKVGTLAARIASTNAELTDCSVVSCYIENYECDIPELFRIPEAGDTYLSGTFYPQGEVGGFVGFLQSASIIRECHVSNTVLNCYGQDDKQGEVYLNGKKVLEGLYNISGRHVNEFIGDIRTTNEQIISVSDCSIKDNEYRKRKDVYSYSQWFKEYECPIVGKPYFIGVHKDILFIGKVDIGDKQGKLLVENIKVNDESKFTTETEFTIYDGLLNY